jgi:hypothetical protein
MDLLSKRTAALALPLRQSVRHFETHLMWGPTKRRGLFD